MKGITLYYRVWQGIESVFKCIKEYEKRHERALQDIQGYGRALTVLKSIQGNDRALTDIGYERALKDIHWH